MREPFPFNSAEVKAVQREKDCGLLEAAAVMRRRKLTEAIENAQNVEDMRVILRYLVQFISLSKGG